MGDRNSTYANTMRLTADLALVEDEIYREIATAYWHDHELFDSDFAAAWFKLVHRSGDHPHEDDLEKDAGLCTHFDFTSIISGAHDLFPLGVWLLTAFLLGASLLA